MCVDNFDKKDLNIFFVLINMEIFKIYNFFNLFFVLTKFKCVIFLFEARFRLLELLHLNLSEHCYIVSDLLTFLHQLYV